MSDHRAGIVDFPMYDLPEIRPATEAWRDAIVERLNRAGFAARPADGSAPDAPRLLTQVCGYKLIDGTMSHVRPVATPDFRVPECPGTDYCSAIVVRADDPARALADLRGRIAAVNHWDSHSGMSALRHAVAPLAQGGRYFAEVTRSGAHRRSIALIRAGAADTAAIDCVTLTLLRRHAPAEVAGLRVIALTEPAPAPAYVTDAAADDDTVAVLREALATPAPPELLIDGVEALSAAAYARVLDMERAAEAAGYPDLR